MPEKKERLSHEESGDGNVDTTRFLQTTKGRKGVLGIDRHEDQYSVTHFGVLSSSMFVGCCTGTRWRAIFIPRHSVNYVEVETEDDCLACCTAGAYPPGIVFFVFV